MHKNFKIWIIQIQGLFKDFQGPGIFFSKFKDFQGLLKDPMNPEFSFDFNETLQHTLQPQKKA